MIPRDLQRQWIQGTGPAARPNAPIEQSLRNVAYALLSGADGWMFDGEDALGQVSTMSLDNQRSLRLAIQRDPVFLAVAEQVAAEMNRWARGLLRPADHRGLASPARLHDADLPRPRPAPRRPPRPLVRRHAASRPRSSTRRCSSSATTQRLRDRGASLVLYLPKIQTAEEAALWHDILSALEQQAGLPVATIKTYVLVEQIEACFQLMEIRAALGLALRRLQHRALGLHQQRLRRDGVGSGLRQSQHRRDHDDLRLHAALRGPRAPRREHARSRRPLRAVAGRHGAEHPGRVRGWRRRRHEARGRRRRARAARGRQRQVGRALEDGAHRPAGVGASRRGESAGPSLPAPRAIRRRTPRA